MFPLNDISSVLRSTNIQVTVDCNYTTGLEIYSSKAQLDFVRPQTIRLKAD